ncbi:MAG TPA: TrkA C-terminal domain-containing protein [Ignavibacteria bacterium]|nr:TrkA C-terminal domain-containing protein [Ignavibacteria bacterium]HMQ98132.1 TrkA C-terminal domain-containing protein [Ignavibacteria bacterium]
MSSKNISFRQKLRYKFDNLMAKGPIALIGWLGILSLVLVVVAALILTVTGFTQDDGETMNFVEASWKSLMRTLDPGTMGGDTGWGFRIIMLGVTLGGIFIVSTLIGVLASGISNKLDELRKGHSFVVEKGHTLILGWSEKIFPIISELLIANENQKNPVIVILGHPDKVAMEDEIKSRMPDTKNTRVICRSGSTIDLNDLEIVNPHDSRSIIILTQDGNDPDISVIKTILALTNNPNRRSEPYHIVAEISDNKNKEVAEMIASGEVTLVHTEDLISRVIAQSCRQSGLSVVYTELLDFDGDEIYFEEEPGLVGKTFKDAVMSYEDSTIIGIRKKDGRITINPPMDTKFESGDKVVAISKDDDTIKLSGSTSAEINTAAISSGMPQKAEVEHTLILGWNSKACSIARELDNYLPAGSTLTVVAEGDGINVQVKELSSKIKNQKIDLKEGNICDRTLLDSLRLEQFNHIILLCYSDIMPEQEADSKTLITLLHLRNIEEKTGHDFTIVSEMMDIRNKELAEVTEADDFIISNKLISLMLSQLSENKDLKAVFDDLFDADGSEIYVKPATDYVNAGTPVNFYTLCESAARKGEIAIGYRINEFSHNVDKAYGVSVNPKKSDMVTFTDKDKLIVIAED